MIAIDTLVHNFLHRTGILHRFGADHAYGSACYRRGGLSYRYRGGVLAPHTRPDSFSSSAITPHSPSDRSWRGASFQYPRGFVQFCPVASNFVHEPSCLIARYAVGSGQVRYLNRWGQAAWPGFALLRHSFSS
jgi:hypothetical protein